MLNKQCRLCLSAIEELRVDSMPLKDVKQLVEKIFVIEVKFLSHFCSYAGLKLLNLPLHSSSMSVRSMVSAPYVQRSYYSRQSCIKGYPRHKLFWNKKCLQDLW